MSMYFRYLQLFIGVCAVSHITQVASYSLNDKKFRQQQRAGPSWKRDGASFNTFATTMHDGLLMNNGEQTFCGIVAIDQAHVFVAASCFDAGAVEQDIISSYQVMLSGPGYETPNALNITGAVINDGYDSQTFANNIAVLTLDNPDGQTFQNQIGDWPSEWPYYYFVQHSLTQALDAWNSVGTAGASPTSDYSPCTSASSLFSENMSALICSSLSRKSFINQNCNTPYKYVVGSSDSNSAIISLYSYTTIPDTATTSFCSNDGGILNFYTNLFNYIPWVENVTDATVLRFHEQDVTGYTETNDANYSMAVPGPNATNDGSHVYGFYGNDQSILGSNSSNNSNVATEAVPSSSSISPTANSSTLADGYCANEVTVTETEYQTTTVVDSSQVCPAENDQGQIIGGTMFVTATTDPLGNIQTKTFVLESSAFDGEDTATETVYVTVTQTQGADGSSSISYVNTDLGTSETATNSELDMQSTDSEGSSATSDAAGSSSGTKSKSGISQTAVIAIVVIVVLVVILGLGYYTYRRRKNQKKKSAEEDPGQDDFEDPSTMRPTYRTRYNFTSYIL